jgi:hypothetical protein
VQKNDTYDSLSVKFFNEDTYVTYLEAYNNLEELIPGKKITLFIPNSQYDWLSGCRQMIVIKLARSKRTIVINDLLDNIPAAILSIVKSAGYSEVEPMLGLTLCRYALAFAEMGTNFYERKPKKDNVGLYNMPAKSIIHILNFWGSLEEGLTEQNIGEYIKGAYKETSIFLLYFVHLMDENNSFMSAVKAYFEGPFSELYASNLWKSYFALYMIKPSFCYLHGEFNEY